MKIFNLANLLVLAIIFQTSCSSKETKALNPSAKVAQQNDPVLTIKVNEQVAAFTRTALLQSASLKKITVEHDPAYAGKSMTYLAVPVTQLFEGLSVDRSGTMLFTCSDGFSAPISTTRLLENNSNRSIAYIAIEAPDQKWPQLKAGDVSSAGPFYLIWEHPEKSKIATEEWPFQLASFELKPSLEKQFPNTVPNVKQNSVTYQGYKLFMQNCFACHTMNKEGQSQLGPDLNLPYNPTEYLKPGYLKKLIRNPQDLRHWPQSKMSNFNQAALSDKDLQNIVRYLQEMSKQKKK